MNAKDLAKLVRETRNAQREYFRTKSQNWLAESKRRERKLDRACDELLGQKRLFEED